MSYYKKITLRRGKEKSVQRRHPWIFSGAIAKNDKDLCDGDIVEVFDANGKYLATGHYQPSTIAVRVFSFSKCNIGKEFWRNKLLNAVNYRKDLLLPNTETNMYRLVNGEGDGLPGLVIDIYGQHIVIQVHSFGMLHLKNIFIEILAELLPNTKAIYLKNAIEQTVLGQFPEEGWVYGTPDSDIVASENGILFKIDIENGQKTGFFIDQRDSRALVGSFAKGRNVLNLFSYSGGFSLYALKNGAAHVDSVDISRKAVDLVDANVRLLGDGYAERHNAVCEDVFSFLDNMPSDHYDVIVLDPPAFAKHHRVKEQSIKGYRNINRKAMEKLRPGGFLFTFSCSQAISRDDFQTIAFSAAALAGKDARVVRRLQHAPCHPVSIYHPEGDYLKGLMLKIE